MLAAGTYARTVLRRSDAMLSPRADMGTITRSARRATYKEGTTCHVLYAKDPERAGP